MTDVPAAEILAEVIRAQEGGPPVLLATLIAGPEGARVGARLLVREDGSALGSLGRRGAWMKRSSPKHRTSCGLAACALCT